MREIIFYCFESGKCPVEEFLDTLTDPQFKKVAFVLDLIETQEVVPIEYFKKLKNTNDIWEARIQSANNIFRILRFLDEDNLVVLNHAFTKKTQKTPKREITKAENRKKDYEFRKGKSE